MVDAVRRWPWRRRVIWLLGALVVLQVVVPLVAYGVRRHLMFFPAPGEPVGDGLAMVQRSEASVVHITRPDGLVLQAILIAPRPAPAAVRTPESATPRRTLLFLHGNAGSAAGRAQTLDHLAAGAGVNVLLVEYAGFGGNPGTATAESIQTDALAAFDYLVAAGTPPQHIVVYGASIGGGAATHVMRSREPAGLITQSTFTSAGAMARKHYSYLPLVAWLLRGELDNAGRASQIERPWLIVHGAEDRIVPVDAAHRLHALAPQSTLHVLERAGHNDVLAVGGMGIIERIAAFVREATR